MRKIIFLDIDGVLQPHNSKNRFRFGKELNAHRDKYAAELSPVFASMRPNDIGAAYYDWHPTALAYLKRLCVECEAKIVISSDWRFYHNLAELQALFMLHNLHEYVINHTNTLGGSNITRSDEISEYLERYNDISHYVILDDIDFKFSIKFPQNFVQCFGYIQEKQFEQAMKILK